MAKYVKYILFLLLTIILHGIVDNAFTEKAVGESFACNAERPSICNAERSSACIAEKASVSNITSTLEQQGQFSMPEFPYILLAELTNLQGHQLSLTRLQRVQLEEYYSIVRGMLQSCAEYDTSLFRHKGRIYNTTTSHYCQPSSEYYVFTLRRIII